MSCPTCLGPSKFQDRRNKTFLSLMGEITLANRAYYLCKTCHAGHVPLDAALGFSTAKLTPAAEQVATLAGTVGSFAEAAEKLLPRLAGLRLAESTVERTTEAAGQRLGDLWADGHTLGLDADWRWNRDALGRTVAYVSIDATGVGIQGDGAARADGRMVWVGKVFNPRAASTEAEAGPKPHPPTARYQAGLMDLDELGVRMRRQAAQVGMDRVELWVALSDGGNGLDNFMDVFFPRATRILDFYHAAEHLGGLAKAYGGGNPEAITTLIETWSHQMKHEGGAAVLKTLEELDLRGHGSATIEEHRLVTGYVRKNLHRMDYPSYREQGWQIGSGHIEAACKTVVNQRLKQSGMRWGCDGADAVCQLRALYEGELSQWDAFWERSIN
ncbi:MAG: ISKra4 family transposase [Isosphaeraceae bacterium]